MSVQYLVDYENVHEAGLYGMDALAPEDNVFIFHTSANDRISLSRLDDVQAWVKVILVPAGKQSLDMHLGSFLGYLIGKEDAETRFAIVSHDSDYRNIADFWNRIYQSADKVRCIHGIKYSAGVTRPDVWASIPADYSAQRSAVREFILRIFSKHAVTSLCDAPCMLVSELCTRLNSLPEYVQDRKRTGKKPMQYLLEECQDIPWIRKQWSQDWAFLLAAQVGEPFPAAAEIISADAAPEEVSDQDEEVPDIMEIGDLNIDEDPAIAEMCGEEDNTGNTSGAAVDAVCAEETDPAVPEEEASEERDLLSVALEFLQTAKEPERDPDGRVRASALRDCLQTLPGFRSALKESGLKPITFIQQLFPGSIQISRIKGIYWASPAGDEKGNSNNRQDTVIAERRKNFYEAAFSNIQKQLTDAGMDQNVADEIAGICMRSDSETEPRKLIHMLLCQRFGNKTGAKYYRQAVKFISA